MTDNNINEIKKAEEEARGIVLAAQKEVESKKAKIREQMKDIEQESRKKLEPKMKEIEKQTDKAIADYEKMAREEERVVLEKLDDVDESRLDKAVGLVIDSLVK